MSSSVADDHTSPDLSGERVSLLPCQKNRLVLVSLVCAGAACGGPIDGADLAETTQEVVGGSIDNGHRCVVGFAPHFPEGNHSSNSGSGVLVSSTQVLTAAHVVERLYPSSDRFDVFIGPHQVYPHTEDASNWVRVKRIQLHPERAGNTQYFHNDLAIVTLARPVNISSCPYYRGGPLPSGMVGRSARIVGFGATRFPDGHLGGGGYRRQVSTPLLEMDWNLVLGNANASGCYGDSGGAVFMRVGGESVLVGTWVAGTCDQNGGLAVRLDRDVTQKWLLRRIP